MKAIIPVAGSGTRLLPFTERIQKCLLPVAGKPILSHIIEPLIDIGIDEITLITGHFSEQVEQFTKRYPGVKFRFCKQEKRLGLGHAIKLGLTDDENPVLVILGDSIFKLDYQEFINNPHNRIGVQEVEDPRRFGVIDVHHDRIIKFLEKPEVPPTNLAISGIYYFASQKELVSSLDFLIENKITTNNEYQLTDAMARMLETGSIFSYFHITDWLDCGLYETMLSTNKRLLTDDQNVVSSTAVVTNSNISSCTIEDRCEVTDSTLNNVILLSGSKVSNSTISNRIVNYNEVVSGITDSGRKIDT
ncbi:MAG: nucleotidyltransferase family protein [Candidatus Marinimicrobia bacterium]|nr:nucleotidyltransferase family protein [Candidatus Neomarinimicrobiota bacterium]